MKNELKDLVAVLIFLLILGMSSNGLCGDESRLNFNDPRAGTITTNSPYGSPNIDPRSVYRSDGDTDLAQLCTELQAQCDSLKEECDEYKSKCSMLIKEKASKGSEPKVKKIFPVKDTPWNDDLAFVVIFDQDLGALPQAYVRFKTEGDTFDGFGVMHVSSMYNDGESRSFYLLFDNYGTSDLLFQEEQELKITIENAKSADGKTMKEFTRSFKYGNDKDYSMSQPKSWQSSGIPQYNTGYNPYSESDYDKPKTGYMPNTQKPHSSDDLKKMIKEPKEKIEDTEMETRDPRK